MASLWACFWAVSSTLCPRNEMAMANYQVQPGDTPSSIAQMFTGNVSRASELIAYNPHKRRVITQNGSTFYTLRVGEMLALPPVWTVAQWAPWAAGGTFPVGCSTCAKTPAFFPTAGLSAVSPGSQAPVTTPISAQHQLYPFPVGCSTCISPAPPASAFPAMGIKKRSTTARTQASFGGVPEMLAGLPYGSGQLGILGDLTDATLQTAAGNLFALFASSGTDQQVHSEVSDFQSAYNAAGGTPAIQVDGQYGPCTQQALQATVNVGPNQPPQQAPTSAFPGVCSNGTYVPPPGSPPPPPPGPPAPTPAAPAATTTSSSAMPWVIAGLVVVGGAAALAYASRKRSASRRR